MLDKKRLRGEGRWFGNSLQQQEYQVILELSGEIPVKILCKVMGINRSSFYYWKKHLGNSDPYAHKCCKIAGIKSRSKHYRYKKPGDPGRIFPNLLSAELNIDGPLQCIVSYMTAFYVNGIYYELTLYIDLWNNALSVMPCQRSAETV